ncbi:transcriptional regulator [Nocardiopsis sp. NRRL B-16309]|uniref:ArsR/SmtB family transcription factor n=1 Tax=Nocardiopsis sp. NRRL B-16309 TaxID=1519494 RepID=UPI0006AEAA8C|nr:winged helix-turn-helix domain-containing protein [Nocardiopsis sp. NRRL B-16309]KOX07837.1 ArsR family transcriptional regulator [Nocardiopsis sp. NRRL B-16309]
MSDDEEHGAAAPGPRRRRPATVREAKALAHPLRVRILRLCLHRELTNRELADRLDTAPGTVLYHVRQLVAAGLLAAEPVRTGAGGALEKPYRATGESWWLDGSQSDPGTGAVAPVSAFQQELDEAGPESVRTFARFALHLSDDDVAELDRRIVAVLDEFVSTDHQRRDQPLYGGAFLLHRPAE